MLWGSEPLATTLCTKRGGRKRLKHCRIFLTIFFSTFKKFVDENIYSLKSNKMPKDVAIFGGDSAYDDLCSSSVCDALYIPLPTRYVLVMVALRSPMCNLCLADSSLSVSVYTRNGLRRR